MNLTDKSDILAEEISEIIFSGKYEEMTLAEVLGTLDLVHARILTLSTEKDS